MISDEDELLEPCAPKLQDIAAKTIIELSHLLLSNDCFKPDLRQQDVEVILNGVRKRRPFLDDSFFENFIDGERLPSSILYIGPHLISDEVFAKLLIGQAQTLRSLDLTGNRTLGSKLLLAMLSNDRECLPQLDKLCASSQWLFSMFKDCNEYEPSDELSPLRGPNNPEESFTDFFPSIQHFRHEFTEDFFWEHESRTEFISRVIRPFKDLKTLELYGWKLSDMSFLVPLSDTLTTLRLYDTPNLSAGLEHIMKLKNLEFLDVSQSSSANGTFPRPASTLYNLIAALPRLKKLDICNTNFCMPFQDDEIRPEQRNDMVDTNVHGLCALQSNLEFLSVFHCGNISPSTKLPAYTICSELNEEHLIVALKTYMDRPDILGLALNEIFQIYRLSSEEGAENRSNNPKGVYLILRALESHQHNRMVQISGTAAIYYSIRNATMDVILKRQVVQAMLDAMEAFNDEPVILRNCCLSLCQLDVPKDVFFVYTRTVSSLVNILNHTTDLTTPRVVIYLLNLLACQTGHESKMEAGVFGAIQAVMNHILRKIERQVADETVEVGYSFLWNITDETPTNCEIFLKHNGIALFLKCYREFSYKRDLVRNMLGLIGNLAEVDYLRSYLMHEELIKIFLDLLDYLDDGIETSYNSAGVLAQLLSDENWTSSIGRDHITARVIDTTVKWDINAKRYINYRSFTPILKLIKVFSSPASQIWSLFAIANLTTTDREKYSAFVISEGGVEILHQIQHDPRSTEIMHKFSNIILQNIEK